MATRIRLKDIAAEAGVTVATVSHALRGTGKISLAMRERIRTLAQQLGYEEDPLLSALARYRKRTSPTSGWHQIAVVVPEDPQLDWRSAPDQVRLLGGIKSAAQRWRLSVEIFAHDGSPRACREISRTLHNRGIRGVILSFPRPWEKEKPRLLEWDKFVAVACKPVFSQNFLNSVTTDHFGNGRILFRELHKSGYRRIGFYFSEGLDLVSNRAFRAGVTIEQQLLTQGREQIPHRVFAAWDITDFKRWIADYRPDCIISQRDQLYAWAQELNVRIPDDVGMAVPSTFEGSQEVGINQHHHRIGEEAVFLLRDQMALGNTGVPRLPLHLIIPSEWYSGRKPVSAHT
ncbi:MAG: LacI family transcriptional regulator [Verrucomicrobia bacterium]|nr:LacI family transcriptional regulator [Verrucomicrobiota bacterium]